jgi:hypothetical protein
MIRLILLRRLKKILVFSNKFRHKALRGENIEDKFQNISTGWNIEVMTDKFNTDKINADIYIY